MNSYERRIIHVELASRPDVATESVGLGRARYVVIRPIDENNPIKKEVPSASGEEKDDEASNEALK